MFANTQDSKIERMLRARGSGASPRPGDRLRLCPEFDADLANTYIERRLTEKETTRFEKHLSICAACRGAIVALSGLEKTREAGTIFTAPRRESRAARLAGWLTVPQWAMAAAAALVLAVTLPLVLSHRAGRTERSAPIVAETTAARPAEQRDSQEFDQNANKPGDVPLAQAETSRPAATDVAAGKREPSNSETAGRAQDEEASEKEKAAADAPKPAVPATPVVARDNRDAQPNRTDSADKNADKKVAEATGDKTAPAAAPSSAAAVARGNEAPLPKLDENEAKSVPDKDGAARVTRLQAGKLDGEERKAETVAAVRPEDNIKPPPSPRATESGRRRSEGSVGAGGAAAGFVAGAPARGSRGATAYKKINGRTFWLHGSVWTDSSYDPAKKLPQTQVIRDTDNYNELMSKNPKMKGFLTGFPADARVVFVFDGTVYVLIPQEGQN